MDGKNDLVEVSKNSKRFNHLLSEAKKAFSSIGYQHVSIDYLSRTSGVSKETIYRHFNDKQDLFRASIRVMAEEFAVNFTHLVEAAVPPEEVLYQCARAIVVRVFDPVDPNPGWLAIGVANSHPDLSQLVFNDYFKSIEPMGRYIAALIKSHRNDDALALDGVTDEELRAVLHLVAQIGALAIGGVSYLMTPQQVKDDPDHLRQSVQLFLRGTLSSAARASDILPEAPIFLLAPAEPARPYKAHIQKLMQVSRDHFYRSGYSGSSLDDIGADAKVGRGTLYRHFGSKAGLFEAVMLQAADDALSPVELRLDGSRSLLENLQHIGQVTGQMLQNPDAISLYRTASAELRNMPHVPTAVHERTRGALKHVVAEYFAACMAAGQLYLPDASWGADQFITLALGGNQYLTANPAPDDQRKAMNVDHAIQTFLHGILH